MTEPIGPFLAGKFRRFDLVERDVAPVGRFGECRRCGACCRLGWRCPELVDQADGSALCGIYDSRPEVCRAFPIDERDLADVRLLEGRCGYRFAASALGAQAGPRYAPPVPGARICSYQHEIRERPTGTVEHLGMDFCADCGTPILAVLPGVVEDVYETEQGGNTVALRHRPNLWTRYAHCREIIVRRGQAVRSEQQIATVGKTGSTARGCHLHFAATNKHFEPGTHIYREEDHWELMPLLASLGIIEKSRVLVYQAGWPHDGGSGIIGPLLVGAGLAGLFLVVSAATGSRALGAAAALPLIPP